MTTITIPGYTRKIGRKRIDVKRHTRKKRKPGRRPFRITRLKPRAVRRDRGGMFA